MCQLEVKNLSFTYRKSRHQVFEDFSLTLSPGHIYGLLGANGSGKSTLLYLLTGLLTPQSGTVAYDGIDVRRRYPSTLRELFIVPDEFELPDVTLEHYVSLNRRFYPRFSEDDMQRYLAVFGMDGDPRLSDLSLGQRKKVYMSFAMATHTRVLLMDEPTNGLDISSKEQFRTFITQGKSADSIFLVSTHQVKDVERVLEHVLLLADGRVVADTSADRIRHDGQIDLEQFYIEILEGKEATDEKR